MKSLYTETFCYCKCFSSSCCAPTPLISLETCFLNYLINIQKISSFALIFFVTTQTIESIALLGSCWLKQWVILKPLFWQLYLTGEVHSSVIFLNSFRLLCIIYDTGKKKKLEGEEKEEEFLLVFLVIYSTAELHEQAYTFLSQRFNTPPELVQVSWDRNANLFVGHDWNSFCLSLSLSLWISHTLEASFVISSLRFFGVEQSKCRNYLDFFFLIFVIFSLSL